MHYKLQELLDQFKDEADQVANDFFEVAKAFKGQGCTGYILFSKTIHTEQVHKMANDYHKLSIAFQTLSLQSLTKDYIKEGRKHMRSYEIDKNGTLYQINFTNEDVKTIARNILSNDIKSFFSTLHKLSKNREYTNRATLAIFGKSIAKK